MTALLELRSIGHAYGATPVVRNLSFMLAKGQIALPIEFLRRLKVDAGTILNLTLRGGRIEIVLLRPMPQADRWGLTAER